MKELMTEKTTLGLRFNREAFNLSSIEDAAKELLKSPSAPWRDLDEIPYWQKVFVNEKATSAGLADGQIRHYISTTALDRDKEIMSAKGADLKHYKKNPIVLWGHDGRDPDNIVGKNLEITKTDTGLLALTQFNLQESKAAQIYRLYKGGWITAWSVGFIPMKGHSPGEKELEKLGVGDVRYIHDKWGLLEYSTVSVPSNPDAITLSIAKELNLSEEMVKELEIVFKDNPEDNNDTNKVILDLSDGEQKKEVKAKATGTDKKTGKDTGSDPDPSPADPAKGEKVTEAIDDLAKEIESLKKAVEEKAGRELSTKNRELIKTCVAAMTAATEALDALLAATEPEPDEGKQILSDEKEMLDLNELLHTKNINLEELGKEICKTLDISKLITDNMKDKA